jgi:hypothetical protein
MAMLSMFSQSQLSQRLAEQSPVVVMARGHSGTRVLSHALEALGFCLGAESTVATGDTQDRRFTRHIKYLARDTLHQPPHAPPQWWRLLRLRWRMAEYLQRLQLSTPHWGWKFPETYLVPGYVAEIFPQARYIHMIRDGRDIAFKDHLTDDPHRRLGRRLLGHLKALDLPHHVQAALSWQFQVERFLEFAKATGTRVCDVRFEELCSDPVRVMQRVCDFLGHPMNDPCHDYLVRSVNREKIGQFREHDPVQVAEVEAAIGPLLHQLGYTSDDHSRRGSSAAPAKPAGKPASAAHQLLQ